MIPSSSSSSSLSSPPPLYTTTTTTLSRPLSSSTQQQQQQQREQYHRELPSIMPLDYNYQAMAPASTISHLRPKTGRYQPQQQYQQHQHQRLNTRSTMQSTRSSYNPELDVDMEIGIADDSPSPPADDEPAYSSLFGDPVPPPPPQEFLGCTLENQSFFRSQSVDLTSDEDNYMAERAALTNFQEQTTRLPQRLFPQEPYTSLMSSRRYSSQTPTSSTQRNFELLPSAIPRLKPPDIQILPNSSSGSAADSHQPSPNYTLLTPDAILMKPSDYGIEAEGEEPEYGEEEDISELKETYTISDGQSFRELTKETVKKSTPKREPGQEYGTSQHTQTTIMPHQFSNESYANDGWFRSSCMDYPEFNKMPKLRPSSKNIMAIKRDEMPLISPVAAMINDSNGSSSGAEERLLSTTRVLEQPSISLDSLPAPERPPSPTLSCLRSLDETIVLTPRAYIKQRRKSLYPEEIEKHQLSRLHDGDKESANDVQRLEEEEDIAPPPIPPKPKMLQDLKHLEAPEIPMRPVTSPVILKDSITTGGDYRVEQARLHKKTSFTIINGKSPAESSRMQSPGFLKSRESSMSSITPSRSSKLAKIQTRKSLSSHQLKLPQLAAPLGDDSPRPSVQFNMAAGSYTPSKLASTQKGILQYPHYDGGADYGRQQKQRASLTSSQDTLPMQSLRRRRSSVAPIDKTAAHMKSLEALPMITDPYRTSIPRLNRSEVDLRLDSRPETAVFPPGALPRPLKPNPNPTRKQKGLLKVLNHQEILSRIPIKSNWSSMDDLLVTDKKKKQQLSPMQDLKARRRSSSTSPSRRSSTQTTSDRRSSNLSTVTTSDFSFRRPSQSVSASPAAQRRKSIFQAPTTPANRRKSSSGSSALTVNQPSSRMPRSKVAKPSSLSPIIGTPNKESSSSQQSPLHAMMKYPPAPPSESISDATSRRDSLSRIPIRSQTNSRSNSRMSSRAGSRIASRTSSPAKEHTGARSSSQMATSRTASRASQHAAASQASSRAQSRAESRSQSRAESRSQSRQASRSTSRASTRPISQPGSRPTSRMDAAKDIANSRSNSRLSIHSSVRAGSISPAMSRKPEATAAATRASLTRRKSISLSPTGRGKRVSTKPAATRRGSLSPQGVKSRVAERSRSRSKTRSGSPDKYSRIPVSSHEERRGGAIKSPPRKKGYSSTDLRRTSSLKVRTKATGKEPASAKKVASSIRKPETIVKRSASNITRRSNGAMSKKLDTGLNKPATATTTGVKREASNVQKKTVGAKSATGTAAQAKPARREISSSMNRKKAGQANSKTPVMSKKNGKPVTEAEKKTAQAAAAASAKTNAAMAKTDSTHSKDDSKAKKEEVLAAVTQTVAAVASPIPVPVPGMSALKRQPSVMSLKRVSSRISLFSKKRSDSNLSKITVPEIEPNENRAPTPVEGAAAILEKSQKTLESIQKTVTEAADEIHKTINENLTDLKSMEQDMGLSSDGMGGSPTASIATVVEKKPGSRQGQPSVSRLGTADDKIGDKSPIPPTQPIEADVSVLNGDAAHAAALAAGERVSERAISVMPEVDCESANFQSSGAITGDADKQVMSSAAAMDASGAAGAAAVTSDGIGKPTSGTTEESEAKRRSPDGQGGSLSGSGKG